MTVGELAKAANVSTRSLRHYEAEGILLSQRKGNGYRVFDASAVETVKQIALLLAMGLSIKVIRELAPCFPESAKSMGVGPKIRAALVRHKSALDARYVELGRLIGKLDAILTLGDDAETLYGNVREQ